MVLHVNWNVQCWNVCGLNSDAKQLALSNAINSCGCAVIYLQETKKPYFDHTFIKSCCPKRFDQFDFVPSRGASGGLAMIWNSAIFTGAVLFQEDFSLVIKFLSMQSAQEWTLVNVYGPCQGDPRVIYILNDFTTCTFPPMKTGCYLETSSIFAALTTEINLEVILTI